jgi:hypothetical protein
MTDALQIYRWDCGLTSGSTLAIRDGHLAKARRLSLDSDVTQVGNLRWLHQQWVTCDYSLNRSN